MTAYTFDQLIDFTRTSGGGYFGPDGLFRFTPASRNLLTYTQEFDSAAWGRSNATITANSTVAPDGTLTADALVEDATNGIHAVQQSVTLAPAVHTFSVYLKAGARTWAQVLNGTIANGFAYFDLANGVVGAVGAGVSATDITAVGDGWYRCSVIFTAVAGVNISAVRAASANGTASYTGTSGAGALYLWGAQLEAVPDANLVLGTERVSSPTITAINANGSVSVVGDTITCTCTTAGIFGFTIAALNAVLGQSYRLSANLLTNSASRSIFADIGGFTISHGNTTEVIVRASANATTTGAYGLYATSGQIGDTFSVSLSSLSVRQITGITGMPTAYTRNLGGLFPPRFDYDPVTLAPRGLLIEEQRTNLLLRSEEFDNASWVKTRSSLTASTTTSPDGTVDADKLVEDTTAAASHIISQNIASHTSGVAYTMTVYAKAAERSQIRVNGDVAIGLSAPAIFDLSSGTVVSAGSFTASIQNAGNGWYRCVCTGTATATSAGVWVVGIAVAGNTSYTGDGTSGVYVWGAQLEAGAFATSYIPTVASQVTRTADQAVVTGANFSRWYNQSEGTFVAEYSSSSIALGAASKGLASANDGSGNNRVYGYISNTGTLSELVTNAGATEGLVSFAGTVPNGVTNKSAWVYKVNDFAILNNGGTVAADNTGAPPSTPNRLEIGQHLSGNQLNGHIRRIRYYPTRLSNTQLQALTA